MTHQGSSGKNFHILVSDDMRQLCVLADYSALEEDAVTNFRTGLDHDTGEDDGGTWVLPLFYRF